MLQKIALPFLSTAVRTYGLGHRLPCCLQYAIAILSRSRMGWGEGYIGRTQSDGYQGAMLAKRFATVCTEQTIVGLYCLLTV